MVKYTERLDKALRVAAWAHERQGQHRKGADIPYIMHPFATMLIASEVTDDEDVLIGCLLHDVLEDVSPNIYSAEDMQRDFGARVLGIVRDVSKDEQDPDWRRRSESYLWHLRNEASDEAVIVSASDKIHNLHSIVIDYERVGDEIWQRFTTKSKADQRWWYKSILDAIRMRQAPERLITQLDELVEKLA